MRLINKGINFKKNSVFFTIFFLVFLFFLFNLSFILGFTNSNIGNSSINLTKDYSSSESLKGWFNISLVDEKIDSIISFKKGSLVIKEFVLSEILEKNPNTLLRDISYTCKPASCSEGYTASNGVETKTFGLGINQSQIVGFKLQGEYIPMLYSLSLNVSSSAIESCTNQLSVDVFDDGVIDWTNNKYNPQVFCGNENYGCYTNSSAVTSFISGSEYCSVITLDSGAAIYVGADVSGTGVASFRFVAGEDSGDICSATISGSGKIGCIINKSLAGREELVVCLSQSNGPTYNLFFEDISPCGYVNDPEQKHDFSIFARGIKYSAPNNLIVNISQSDEEYLIDNYDGECSAGCVIPVKITSGVAGNQITLSSASITYDSNGISVTQVPANIFSVSKTPALVSMPFSKVFVDNLLIGTGNTPGTYNISVYFGDKKVGTQEIGVLALPLVGQLYPLTVPAGYSMDYVLFGSSNSSSYIWYFGDNSSIETNSSRAKHVYSELGTKTITISAKNSLGEINRSFSVSVISPQAYINGTTSFYKTRVLKLKNQINSFPSFVKSNINSKLGLDAKEELLVSLENEYKNAGNDSSKYVSIVAQLNALNLPESINSTTSSSGRFLFQKDATNLADARSTQNTLSVSDDILRESIYSWAVSSLDVFGESKIYEAIYNEISVPLLSYFNFRITPIITLNNVYFAIADGSAIVSGATPQTLGSGKVIKFDSLVQGVAKNLELILLDKSITLYNAPIYYFPNFLDLVLIDSEVTCNYNNKCERASGENSENCRSDCKPWARILWLWLLVLVIFFVLYIIAQEWYKRHYEDYLFKNKDDLYNLINFIDNAEDQTLGKKDIYMKLEAKGWDREQIEYAYRKYKGQRTGMWEIPIFKFLEKTRVKKELDSRKNIINPQIPPRPLIIFQRNKPLVIKSNIPGNKNTTLNNFGKPNNIDFNKNNNTK